MTTEPTDRIDTNDGDGSNAVKDGLSGRVDPLPREAVDTVGPEAGSWNDSRPETENKSAATDEIEGVNKAVGPAEDSDGQVADARALTTDTSPSD